MARYECEDCGLAAMDLPDGVDPEFVFERGDDGVMRRPGLPGHRGRRPVTAASGADRVIAQTVDSAWRCDGCGERFTSLRVMGEHTCPASGADQPTLRDQLADPCGMRADGRPCPCCGDWPVTLPPGPCSCQPTHEIVIEVYEGDSIGMRCATCRERIGVRPARAAAMLTELNSLARGHLSASGVDQPTLRDQLSAVLREHGMWWAEDTPGVLDALLPVIEADRERAKADAAAEALEQASMDKSLPGIFPSTVAWLRDRAAALRGSTGGGT